MIGLLQIAEPRVVHVQHGNEGGGLFEFVGQLAADVNPNAGGDITFRVVWITFQCSTFFGVAPGVCRLGLCLRTCRRGRGRGHGCSKPDGFGTGRRERRPVCICKALIEMPGSVPGLSHLAVKARRKGAFELI